MQTYLNPIRGQVRLRTAQQLWEGVRELSKTLLPDEFGISDSMRAWARFKVPQVNIDAEHENFCDYWRAHGKKMADWVACWRVWMRRVPEFSRKPVRQSWNETPQYERETRSIAPPVLLRDHPLFKGVGNK